MNTPPTSKIKLSERQKFVIHCMKNGWILERGHFMDGVWWLSAPNNFDKRVNVRTALKLLALELIQESAQAKILQNAYTLTEAGININID
jgi:hypothetical protein